MASAGVLIVGLVERGAGKTTLAVAVASALRKVGGRPGVFKPVARHDWFTQYDLTLENLRRRGLFCEDVVRLSRVAGIREPYELLNPVDVLLAPLDPTTFIDFRVPNTYYSFQGDLARRTILARLAVHREGELRRIALVNEWSLDRGILVVDEEVIEGVLEGVDEVVRVESIDAFKRALLSKSTKAVESCYRLLSERYPILVVEGYGDVAWPLPWRARVDVVLAVAPGVVLVYDPVKYKTAVELVSSAGKLYRGVRVSDIFGLLRPERAFKVGPVGKVELPESFSLRKYGGLLSYLVELLEEGVET